jgi:hypothetical protein
MPENTFESAPTESFLVESFTALTLVVSRFNSSLNKKISRQSQQNGLFERPSRGCAYQKNKGISLPAAVRAT